MYIVPNDTSKALAKAARVKNTGISIKVDKIIPRTLINFFYELVLKHLIGRLKDKNKAPMIGPNAKTIGAKIITQRVIRVTKIRESYDILGHGYKKKSRHGSL